MKHEHMNRILRDIARSGRFSPELIAMMEDIIILGENLHRRIIDQSQVGFQLSDVIDRVETTLAGRDFWEGNNPLINDDLPKIFILCVSMYAVILTGGDYASDLKTRLINSYNKCIKVK